MSNKERTFIAVKPDGVQRGLISEIIDRFERKGYKLAAMKLLTPSKELAEKHYAEHADKPMFAGLVEFVTSGPMVAMIWEGRDAVRGGRRLIGSTNPAESPLGSIRGDLCVDTKRNVVHGSDSVESAEREIALWFAPWEIVECRPRRPLGSTSKFE